MASMETKRKISTIVIHIALVLISITMMVPFLWMILTSFKSVTEATAINPFVIFPKLWRTDVAFRAKCKMFSRHLQKPILKTEKGRFKGL